MSAKSFIQQDVGAFDARAARLAYNANAASAVWQTLIVCGEAHAESLTKVGLFAREYGSFMVQIGQSDTDLRQQFGGNPQSITLCDRGYGITTWDPDVVMLLALQCVSGFAARPDFNAALAYAIDRSMEPEPILDFLQPYTAYLSVLDNWYPNAAQARLDALYAAVPWPPIGGPGDSLQFLGANFLAYSSHLPSMLQSKLKLLDIAFA